MRSLDKLTLQKQLDASVKPRTKPASLYPWLAAFLDRATAELTPIQRS